MNNDEYDILAKIVLVGDSGVGKSSILYRYCDDNFTESSLLTIGVDFKIRTINIDNKIIKYQIWDTAGQERFRTIIASYYRGADIIILTYDITNRESFKNIKIWLDEINHYASPNIIKILVGNKLDLKIKREVSQFEAESYALSTDMTYIETSAKNSINTNNLFNDIGFKILDKKLNIKANTKSEIKLSSVNIKKECCF